MRLDTFERQIFFTTLRITTAAASGASASIGTGFICAHPLPITDKVGIFLVSNRHVLADPTSALVLNFHKRNESGNGPSLGESVPLTLSDYKELYYGHPDQDLDLACINISAFVDNEFGTFHRHLGAAFFPEEGFDTLYPGQEVLFIGYPENRFDVVHNLPLLRKGFIASTPETDFNGQPHIVIDAQVFPGSSGSPVFVERKGQYRLLGVVTQTMIRNQKMQAIPAGMCLGVQQTLGLGIIIKSSAVIDLLSYAAVQLAERIERGAVRQAVEFDDPVLSGTAGQT